MLVARLDVWECVGLLVKEVLPQARALDQWFKSGPSDFRYGYALLYFAESVLYTLYDGDDFADSAETLACKLWDAMELDANLTATAFAKQLSLTELEELEFCVDEWLYAGEDDRANGDDRWRAARAVITDTKILP